MKRKAYIKPETIAIPAINECLMQIGSTETEMILSKETEMSDDEWSDWGGLDWEQYNDDWGW